MVDEIALFTLFSTRSQSDNRRLTPFGLPTLSQVRYGNLSCAKTLVESGAWPSRRNTLGFTPREDLLNAQPMFARGRLPKALRATLEYIQHAEVRALQHADTCTMRHCGFFLKPRRVLHMQI